MFLLPSLRQLTDSHYLFNTYVSVSYKPDHPPRATPGDSHVFTASGVGFLPNFLCPGGRGFELEKFPTVLKEKCRNFLKKPEQFEKQVLFHNNTSAKTVDVYCIFNNRPFSAISVILNKFSGHPRVILLMLDHHQNSECLNRKVYH